MSNEIVIDLGLSISIEKTELKFIDISTDKVINYIEYEKLSATDKSKYVIESLSETINNGEILDYFDLEVYDF